MIPVRSTECAFAMTSLCQRRSSRIRSPEMVARRVPSYPGLMSDHLPIHRYSAPTSGGEGIATVFSLDLPFLHGRGLRAFVGYGRAVSFILK